MQNLPRMSEGLSLARLFFQREVRSPMFYTPPCNKDEIGAGLQRHYDRERQREVRNVRRGKGLESPLELYVGQKVFLQDEIRRGHPFSVPGTVVSVRDSGRSGWVWCPGKARRFLRNRRKMRLMMDDEDEEEGDPTEPSCEPPPSLPPHPRGLPSPASSCLAVPACPAVPVWTQLTPHQEHCRLQSH